MGMGVVQGAYGMRREARPASKGGEQVRTAEVLCMGLKSREYLRFHSIQRQ